MKKQKDFMNLEKKMYKPLVMSNAEYHSKKDYESSSSIRDALLNPKKYIFRKTNETVPTKAMEE